MKPFLHCSYWSRSRNGLWSQCVPRELSTQDWKLMFEILEKQNPSSGASFTPLRQREQRLPGGAESMVQMWWGGGSFNRHILWLLIYYLLGMKLEDSTNNKAVNHAHFLLCLLIQLCQLSHSYLSIHFSRLSASLPILSSKALGSVLSSRCLSPRSCPLWLSSVVPGPSPWIISASQPQSHVSLLSKRPIAKVSCRL